MKNTPVNSPLRNWKLVSGTALLGLCLTAIGCGTADLPPGQTQKGAPVPSGPFTLTVATTDPTAGVPITVTPVDSSATGGGTSTFTLNYAAGTVVTLTAPNFQGLEIFSKWSGCQDSLGPACVLTMTSSTTVTAVYVPQVSFTLQPQVGGPNGCCTPPYYLILGQVEQIYLHPTFLNNQTNGNVTWTVVSSDPAFSPGTIDQNGNYVPPYPAPPYVTITAVSQFDPVATVSVVINLGEPSEQTGPALTVDTSAVTHPISPLIYGMNSYGDSPDLLSDVPVPIVRWGGDSTTRYNYLQDVTNSAADFFFENNVNTNTAYPDTSQFNTQFALDAANGAQTMVTMPMIGYVTNRFATPTVPGAVCGSSVTKYGMQQKTDSGNPDCGNGYVPSGFPPINWGAPVQVGAFTVPTGWKVVTNPLDTSTAVDQTFDTGWVNYLTGKFGNAASGGPTIYELDNEPEYWNGTHVDIHPQWLTYDELTNKGIAYATAIKTADPTAQVSGPVISNFQNYFYSTADEWAGYNFGNGADNYCYCYNSNPADRVAHGNVPLLAYYLQQMSAASATAGYRLLDYLDLHGYYATTGIGTPAGSTSVQQAREFSVRALYDPTYFGNGETDPETVANSAKPFAVQLIPFMQGLVSANYPGTKTAITEYNWGGQEAISGAIAQAEVLAIFGQQGLDMATLWGPPDTTTQVPGLEAFKFFQNYDGAGSKFGDGSLNTSSADPTQLTIYAAKRSSDGKTTVIVFNKTYQDESSSLAITTTATSAKVYQYSIADLTKITAGTAATVTSGSVTVLFPAQSITLLEF